MGRILIVLLFVIIEGCAPARLAIVSTELGSDLSSKGEISDRNLEFVFKKYKRGGQMKDFFNYMYFEGDTLCFSFGASRTIDACEVTAWFINPDDNRVYQAERIDIHGKTISGFSLMGSIMEKFFYKDIAIPAKGDEFENESIPFIVNLRVMCGKEVVEKKVPGSFSLRFVE